MSDAAWALQTARQVGPIHPPHAHPHPIHKLHTGPLHSHVAGRTDHLPSNVPNGAYVLPADIVSALGEGNTMAGFKIAKRMFGGAGRHFEGTPYAGDNGPYGQGNGLPYGHAKGGQITIGRNEKQTTVGPGYEEWQTQPSGGVPDPLNGVTGPTLDPGPSFQEQLEDNRNRQDIIDQHVGTPLADGGSPDDRAAAMGYTIDAYKGAHPTIGGPDRDWKGNIIQDHPEYPLTEFKSPNQPYAGFFSSSPYVASGFAQALSKSGTVFPTKLKFQNPVVIDAEGKHAGAFQYEGLAKANGVLDKFHQFKRAIADEKGNDGVILKNTKDEGDVYIPRHSHQVRSRWAEFDPAKAQSGNIGHANGGSVDQGVPVAVAGGEHVLAPHEVMFAGLGDLDAGHRALDEFVIRQRAKTVKTLKGLPGPKRD